MKKMAVFFVVFVFSLSIAACGSSNSEVKITLPANWFEGQDPEDIEAESKGDGVSEVIS